MRPVYVYADFGGRQEQQSTEEEIIAAVEDLEM
jgi:hypothetical protein